LNKAEVLHDLEPETTALLVIDMQNDFAHAKGYFGRIGETMADVIGCDPRRIQDSVPAVLRLLRVAREAGVFVVHTQEIRDPDTFNSVRRLHRILPRTYEVFTEPDEAIPPPLRPGSWGAEILEELTPRSGEYSLTKRSFSAFFQTDLLVVLRRRGIRTVVIAGTLTHVCVLHTAFDAHAWDFDVVVAKDATSSWAGDLQEPVMRLVDLIIGRAVSVEDIETSLGVQAKNLGNSSD